MQERVWIFSAEHFTKASLLSVKVLISVGVSYFASFLGFALVERDLDLFFFPDVVVFGGIFLQGV